MSNKNIIFRLINDYLFNNHSKIKVYSLILFGLFISLVGILEPFFMKELISYIEIYLKTNEYDISNFIKIFIYWGIFIIIVLIIRASYEYIIDSMLLKSYNIIYKDNAEKFLYMSYDNYLSKKQGSTFKIFDRGMEFGYFFTEQLFTKILESFFSIIFIVIVLIYIDYRMAIATLLMVPIMLYIGININKNTYKIQENINSIREKAYGLFGDGISNIGLIKTLVLEKLFLKKLGKKLNNAYDKQIKVTIRWVLGNSYTGFLVMISRFLVLSTGIYFLIHGSITFATLFLFFSYIGYIYFPLSFIFSNLKNAQKQITAVSKFYNEIDSIKLDKDIYKKNTNINFNGNIIFDKVSFSYGPNKKIINKLSFTIKKGTKVAFVGNTGAGKSTIINLLFRFWNIDKGEINIGGLDLNNISTKKLRNNIGIVMQDNSLFNTSIKENLQFANSNATQDDLINALKNAEAHFVFDLEKGINTIIGERGLKLSGGEKQRLAIARLFLKNPKILILDEATSALDNKTEKLVQKALDKLMKGKTSIVIAHRLSTIKNSDKIFMLENGKIIEEGGYLELIKKNGKFAELANPEHLTLN